MTITANINGWVGIGFSNDQLIVNIDSSYYLLWAYGSSDTFGRHAARGSSATPISFTAPAPVPAAAWLFGSGLLGLLRFGVAKKARA